MKNSILGEMGSVIVKVSYNGEIRKISFEGKTFAALYETISVLVGQPAITLKYTDEEGDLITLSSDLELKAAVNGRAQLNLYVEPKATVAPGPGPSAPPMVIFSNPSTSLVPELSSLRIDSDINNTISYPSVVAPIAPPQNPFAYPVVSAPVHVINSSAETTTTSTYVAAPEPISPPPVAPMVISADAPVTPANAIPNAEGEPAQRKQDRKLLKELMREERKAVKLERKEMKKSEKEKRKESKKEWKRKDKKAKTSSSESEEQTVVVATNGAEPVVLGPVGGGLVEAKMAPAGQVQAQDPDKYAALVDAVLASGVRQKICDLLAKHDGDVTKVADVFGKKAYRHEKKMAKKHAQAANA